MTPSARSEYGNNNRPVWLETAEPLPVTTPGDFDCCRDGRGHDVTHVVLDGESVCQCGELKAPTAADLVGGGPHLSFWADEERTGRLRPPVTIETKPEPVVTIEDLDAYVAAMGRIGQVRYTPQGAPQPETPTDGPPEPPEPPTGHTAPPEFPSGFRPAGWVGSRGIDYGSIHDAIGEGHYEDTTTEPAEVSDTENSILTTMRYLVETFNRDERRMDYSLWPPGPPPTPTQVRDYYTGQIYRPHSEDNIILGED